MLWQTLISHDVRISVKVLKKFCTYNNVLQKKIKNLVFQVNRHGLFEKLQYLCKLNTKIFHHIKLSLNHTGTLINIIQLNENNDQFKMCYFWEWGVIMCTEQKHFLRNDRYQQIPCHQDTHYIVLVIFLNLLLIMFVDHKEIWSKKFSLSTRHWSVLEALILLLSG